MDFVLIFVVFAALFLLAWGLTSRRGRRQEEWQSDWPFYAKRPLTQVEQVLFYRLVRALPEHVVLAQVQVSRVLGVRRGANFHEWNNRINRLSYDFVICRKDFVVVAIVELDDKSHESEARANTDGKKSKASEDAGLGILRWRVDALPDVEEIRRSIVQPVDSVTQAEGTARLPGVHLTRG
jgi:hypothetical protein